MVAVRKAIEATYTGECSISEYQKYEKSNGATGFQETSVLADQACRLSFEQVTTTNPSDTATALTQVAKIFISPDISIKPGSKISVTQDGITTEYKNSGESALYSTHQEVMLDLFDGWA